ncbi:hypothetical protein EPUL_004721 [Erysiphe pulchra]|uniref:Uncharacterized protein n=1 Tax=Erysiphe pulchra TaxID=225359 RepID=A0A2S4PJZ3_9PEZI|nr:hypothetical protein EPUL_004721 [Erysiphe pulchra]
MSDLNHHDFQIFTTLRYDRLCQPLQYPTNSKGSLVFLYMPFYHQRRLVEACKYFGWSSALAKVQDCGKFISDIQNFICTYVSEDYDLSSPLRIKVIVCKAGSIIFEGEPTATINFQNLYPLSLGDLLRTARRAHSDSHIYVLHVSRRKIHPFPHSRFKTTYRRHYYLAQKEVGILHELNRNEVLLTNTSDEVMEGSYSSVYFFRRGQWVTPPLESGGQDGTTRKWALSRRLCVERKIMFESLVNGEHCCISNGVRGFHIAMVKLT